MSFAAWGKLAVAVVVSFFVGVIACAIGSHTLRRADSSWEEEMRTTSPTGKLDAVMMRSMWGGAVGGFDWYVYVVPKGEKAPHTESRAVFHADTLSGEKLVWNQAHLLEIHYDVAQIRKFDNLWAIHDEHITGEHHYYVEVKLVPCRPDFSLLTNGGTFRESGISGCPTPRASM